MHSASSTSKSTFKSSRSIKSNTKDNNKSGIATSNRTNEKKSCKSSPNAEINGDGRLPLFIIIHPDFHNQIPKLLQKSMKSIENSHQIIRLYDSKLINNLGSDLTKFYLNSPTHLHPITDSLYQETIISSNTNTLQSINDGYISWGNANVALENIYMYRGRMRIIVIVLTEEANVEWSKIENKELERFVPNGTTSKKAINVEQIKREISPSDYELVKMDEFSEISNETESKILERLLWVMKPEMMIEKEREELIRGSYLNPYKEKICNLIPELSPDEYVAKEIMPYVTPLLKRVAECFQVIQEGKPLDDEARKIAEKPLLYIGEELNLISKNLQQTKTT